MCLLKGGAQESVMSLPGASRQLASAGSFVPRGIKKAKRPG